VTTTGLPRPETIMRTSIHALAGILALSTVTLAVGCASNTEEDAAASDQAISSGITQADMEEADRLIDTSIYLQQPKLLGAKVKLVAQSDFDGSRSQTWVVKDSDGRLFRFYGVAAPSPTGGHASTSQFTDGRHFLLLNKIGIDWVLANLKRVPTDRNEQILTAMADPDYRDDVKDLGKTAAGESILWFNSGVFVVTPRGMQDDCRTSSPTACTSAWKELDGRPNSP